MTLKKIKSINDESFQQKKAEIAKINSTTKYKPEKDMIEPLIKIQTDKLDGSWKIVMQIKQINDAIEVMVDTGSPIQICKGTMAKKYDKWINKRPVGFPAKSVLEMRK